jgi:hypothetical protein
LAETCRGRCGPHRVPAGFRALVCARGTVRCRLI